MKHEIKYGSNHEKLFARAFMLMRMTKKSHNNALAVFALPAGKSIFFNLMRPSPNANKTHMQKVDPNSKPERMERGERELERASATAGGATHAGVCIDPQCGVKTNQVAPAFRQAQLSFSSVGGKLLYLINRGSWQPLPIFT